MTSPFFLAGKAGAACGISIATAKVLGVPDLVTAAFVAVLCCSPGALMGLRTSFEQLVGSVLGGVFGTAAIMSLPQAAGVPLAVTLSILACFALRCSQATVAAAFTALFVQIVTFGEPWQTLGVRLESVGIAALAAFVVNVGASAFFYRTLFGKRLSKMRAQVMALLSQATKDGPEVLYAAFAPLAQLDQQLGQALRELAWRRNESTRRALLAMQIELHWLRDYAHLIVDLAIAKADPGQSLRFLAWLGNQQGEPPSMSGQAEETARRILEHLDSQQ